METERTDEVLPLARSARITEGWSEYDRKHSSWSRVLTEPAQSRIAVSLHREEETQPRRDSDRYQGTLFRSTKSTNDGQSHVKREL